MEEEQNQGDLIDTGLNIGKNIAKRGINEGKKTTKKLGKKIAKQLIKWLIKILSNPLVWKIILIVAIVYIFFASAYYVVEEQKEKDPNDAAEEAIAILESYSMSIGSNFNKNSLLHNYSNTSRSNSIITSRSNNQEVGSNTNNSNETLNRVVIEPNTDKTGYEITYKNDAEYLEEIRKYLKEDLNLKSEFNDLEVGILGALIDHGATLEHYNDEELHCFASFVKAEASTQYLDLRPNSQKIIDGEYVPRKIEDLEENEVPGTILVQRTNTNGNTTNILEYMLESDFNTLKDAGDSTVLNYFTVNDDGKLIIAKWDMENIKVTIEGDGLPEDITAEEMAQDTGGDKYIIKTEEIPYRQYIQKYTIPFEFFIQLLVVTTEPDFCMELVNHVLNSKIVINIQEQETFTQTDETKRYFVHIKDEKYIDYNITALPNDSTSKNLLEEKDNHFLKYMKDDENNDCTNYTYAEPIVKIHREYTSHSYSFEVIEADTWIAHFTKEYGDGEVTSSTYANDSSIEGSYDDRTSNEIITDTNIINEDNNIKTFINQKKSEYEPKIIVPIVTVSDYTDNSGNKHKKINVVGGSINAATDYTEVKDDEGNSLGYYNLPSSLVVTTSPTTQIPSLQYSFKVNSDESGYNVQTNINPLIGVQVSKLDIQEFQKINLNSHIDTTVTRYQADSNPVTSTHIYATESGSPGKGRRDRKTVYEKFLLAYHNSPGARNNLNSVDSWLYEMMEKRECTIELVDVVKYLLYMYDGKDRGVTELTEVEDLFNSEDFSSIHDGIYGNTIQEKVWFALKELGYSDISIAAAMGNIHYESGTFDPTRVEGGYNEYNGGIGICQWTNNNRGSTGRNQQLRSYATHKGTTWQDEDTQVEFLIGELTLGGGADGYADYQLYDNERYYPECFYKDDWINATDTETLDKAKLRHLTETFCHTFERPNKTDADNSMEQRYGHALMYYNEFHGKEIEISSGNQQNIEDINLYNSDETVNQEALKELYNILNNIVIEKRNGPNKSGLQYKQCTWWAYERATMYLQKYGKNIKEYPKPAEGYYGNGGDWLRLNRYFKTGKIPKANSLVVWSANANSKTQYGHVAYVEAVDYKNKIMYISEAGGGNYWCDRIVPFNFDDNGKSPYYDYNYDLAGYIYLDEPL